MAGAMDMEEDAKYDSDEMLMMFDVRNDASEDNTVEVSWVIEDDDSPNAVCDDVLEEEGTSDDPVAEEEAVPEVVWDTEGLWAADPLLQRALGISLADKCMLRYREPETGDDDGLASQPGRQRKLPFYVYPHKFEEKLCRRSFKPLDAEQWAHAVLGTPTRETVIMRTDVSIAAQRMAIDTLMYAVDIYNSTANVVPLIEQTEITFHSAKHDATAWGFDMVIDKEIYEAFENTADPHVVLAVVPMLVNWLIKMQLLLQWREATPVKTMCWMEAAPRLEEDDETLHVACRMVWIFALVPEDCETIIDTHVFDDSGKPLDAPEADPDTAFVVENGVSMKFHTVCGTMKKHTGLDKEGIEDSYMPKELAMKASAQRKKKKQACV